MARKARSQLSKKMSQDMHLKKTKKADAKLVKRYGLSPEQR